MPVYVFASDKPWSNGIKEKLEKEIGATFNFIGKSDDLKLEALKELKPRYVFFGHWSSMIPKEIYDEFECVIFHMTDLPFGRGGSPLQNLISRGIYETRISAFRCVKELDAGPVYMKKPFSLYGTAEEIYIRAGRVMEEMIVEMVNKEPLPVEQCGEPVVFKRRKPHESDVSDITDIVKLFDYIRMLDAQGYPPAYLETEYFRFEFQRPSLRHDGIISDVKITKKIGDGKI